jgi:hypothetical protein
MNENLSVRHERLLGDADVADERLRAGDRFIPSREQGNPNQKYGN